MANFNQIINFITFNCCRCSLFKISLSAINFVFLNAFIEALSYKLIDSTFKRKLLLIINESFEFLVGIYPNLSFNSCD